VKGALHFEVPIQEGKNLMVALRNCMPGYAVPRYVQEIAGEKSKTII
jgi:L-lysine 2,3-aminomutase